MRERAVALSLLSVSPACLCCCKVDWIRECEAQCVVTHTLLFRSTICNVTRSHTDQKSFEKRILVSVGGMNVANKGSEKALQQAYAIFKMY